MKGKIKHSLGYLLVYRPEHPFCNNHGYLPEHRAVVEENLKITINPKTHHVHHIDGVKCNNDLSNLQLLTFGDHMRVEQGWVKNGDGWHKTCKRCKKFLEINQLNFYIRSNGKPTHLCKMCSRDSMNEKTKNKRGDLFKKRGDMYTEHLVKIIISDMPIKDMVKLTGRSYNAITKKREKLRKLGLCN